MAQNLNDLLSSNAEVKQYFQGLPKDVQNSVCNSGCDICSLEDLLRLIKGANGSCC